MQDTECVQFLQWALPRLRLRWPGFRKVRAQVCKRIGRRMRQLHIERMADYRAYLDAQPQEWEVLDAACRVTISRFYRDRAVFEFLAGVVLPELARQATTRGAERLRAWSAGCGAGEEPYTLGLVWDLRLQSLFPGLGLDIVATDVDSGLIRRAEDACYPYSSIDDLPEAWRTAAFERCAAGYCLKPEFRGAVRFLAQDIRLAQPPGPFDLVLCRNLVFTYFDAQQQRLRLEAIAGVLLPGGGLVLGIHEELPEDARGLNAWSEPLRIFRKEVAPG